MVMVMGAAGPPAATPTPVPSPSAGGFGAPAAMAEARMAPSGAMATLWISASGASYSTNALPCGEMR